MKRFLSGLTGRLFVLFCFILLAGYGRSAAQIITTVAGTGTGSYNFDNVQATAAHIHNPTTVAADGSGNIYIADWANARVRKVNAAGIITTIAGTGIAGYNGDNIVATTALLRQPNGVAVDAAGNVYVAEMSGHRLRKISTSGIITTLAGNGAAGATGDGLPATAAKLNSPTNLVISGGNIYIADWGNNKVRMINSAGIMSTIAGGATSGFFGDGGPATASLLNNPYSVSVDALNNLYISDEHNYRLRKIDLSTNIITTIAGIGTPGSTGDGFAATAAAFNQPDGIVADAGSLYIADFSNNKIRKINLTTGIVNTYVGSGVAGFAGDGGPASASSVQINGPAGIAIDVTGNVYIADFVNNRIRKISVDNHAPVFDSGRVVTKTICDGASLPLSSTLSVTDIDLGQTETWSLYTNALNGTIFNGPSVMGVGPFRTATSTGGDLTLPSGITYVHTAGMPLVDSFVFRVNDGISIDSIKVIVNLTPHTVAPPITGPTTLCPGSSITLAIDTSGGIWISRDNSVATISSTGDVTGINPGTDSIQYVVFGACGEDTALSIITVSVGPSAIGGPGSVCIGSAIELSNSVSGGTWSVSNGRATITSTGHLSGLTAGLDTVTYAIGSCSTATIVSISGPAGVTPRLASVCQGSTVTLSDATAGGSWSSGTPSVATVNSSGVVTGISNGTVRISYTVAGCSAVDTVTVISSPAPISPASMALCTGSGNLFTDATTGGTWSVTNTHASISGGLVTALSAGIDTIRYTVGGCFVSATLTVNATPAAITPSGAVSVCIGGTTTLGDVTPGGSWSSGSTGVATINSSGVVTGISGGTAAITYTLGSCIAIKSITVTGPVAILPYDPTICAGATIGLTNAVSGGIWTSGASSVATVSSGGLVTGVSAGIAPITYTIGTCFSVDTVFVNIGTAAITPLTPVTICAGSFATLDNATPGGTWGSSNTSIATVSGTGAVTGVAAGTANITYTVGSCFSIKPVTVSPAPAALSPASANICNGNTTTFSESVPGGTWSSSAPAVASVTAGTVLGLSPGTASISYAIGSCAVSATVTVSAVTGAGAISGPSVVCVGSSITMTDGVTGGVWSSGSPSLASVSSTGVVTGLANGLATISYTVANACGSVSVTATVNVVASGVLPIVGSSSVCAGTFITLTDATAGGTWSATNGRATVTTGGLVTGVTPGADTIIYSVINVCGASSTSKVITVGPFLTAGSITGPGIVCVGSTITLTDLAPSGVWSASNSRANVIGGVVTGFVAGIDTISYTVSSTCGSAVATKVVTVSAVPSAGTITGPSSICIGSTTTYTDASTGGVWTMSNARATISLTGVVTPLAVGADTISYTVTNTCGTATATKIINIGPFLTAGAIAGPSVVCAGSIITLTDAATGGVWSAANTHAVVSGSGVVTGASAGADTISYTVTGSCGTAVATAVVTVNPLPDAGSISGPAAICMGSPSTYTVTATGGTWSVTNAHATISSTGVLTPVSAGTDTVLYTVTNSCGSAIASRVVTIGAFLSAGTISGPSLVCTGAPVTLTDAAPGGTWAATNARASVSGGIVTGLLAGIDTITYTVSGSCGTAVAMHIVTVSLSPAAGTIGAPSLLCTGTNTLFLDAAPGGVWSSSNATATVSSTGMVTAVAAGTDTIAYTVTNTCGTAVATKIINIILSPDAGVITGPTIVCLGASITLTDAAPGGVWSASNANATVSPSGVVTGVSTGMVTISYAVSGTCGTIYATYAVGVGASATAGIIAGPSSVCVGALITLTDPVAGGFWSSSNGNATVATGGVVTGITAGTDTINYTVTGPCGVGSAVYPVTINALPVVGIISGLSAVCVGDSITLTDAVAGGVWSAATGAASVDAASGVVTGIAGGTGIINYTITNACGAVAATRTIVVNALPDPGTISGPLTVCTGSSVIYSATAPGGVWSAGNANAVVSGTGTVTGVSGGTDPISYTITNGCGTASAVQILTIIDPATAGPIIGSSSVCVGSGITLSSATPGGAWSLSNANASLVGPGIVDGITMGIDTVYYTVTGSCGTGTSAKVITVNPVPVVAAISGPTHQCAGTLITLASATTGGIWSSSAPAVASIGTSSGSVAGVAVGTATITYTVTNIYGCPFSVTAADTVSVMSVVAPITGPADVCPGSAITLAHPLTGGTWSSASPAVATVAPGTGLVTGVSTGTAVISYMVTTACGTSYVSSLISVDPVPSVGSILGLPAECPGAVVTLTDATPGGVWTSANPAVAIVGSSSGMVTGIVSGTANISYTVTNSFGCTNTAAVTNTVNAAPSVAAITGTTNECIGSASALSDVTAGGTWSTSNPAIATVSGTGLVTGITAGIVHISYTVAGTGCSGFAAVADTVSAVPVAMPVTGITHICLGTASPLADASFGGVWSSSNTAVATVSSTGMVTGVAIGTAEIYYTVANSCGTMVDSVMVTVQLVPDAGAISGAVSVCQGASITLTDPATGGVWSASNARATVSGGIVTGVGGGLDTIRYTVTNTCGTAVATRVISVSALPYPGVIGGYTNVCAGLSIALTETVTGGIWSSSAPSVATVSGGMVAGVSVGSATISYTLTNSCGSRSATHAVSVVPSGTCRTLVGGPGSTADDITFYPVPASSQLNIRASVPVNVQLLSVDGKVLIEKADATTLDVSNIASGVYLIKVFSTDGQLLKVSRVSIVQ